MGIQFEKEYNWYLVAMKLEEPQPIKPTWFIKVHVWHQTNKGIACSIYPVERKDGIETVVLGRGLKFLFKPCARLSRKQVFTAFGVIKQEIITMRGQGDGVLKQVLEKEKMRLLEPPKDVATNSA